MEGETYIGDGIMEMMKRNKIIVVNKANLQAAAQRVYNIYMGLYRKTGSEGFRCIAELMREIGHEKISEENKTSPTKKD